MAGTQLVQLGSLRADKESHFLDRCRCCVCQLPTSLFMSQGPRASAFSATAKTAEKHKSPSKAGVRVALKRTFILHKVKGCTAARLSV